MKPIKAKTQKFLAIERKMVCVVEVLLLVGHKTSSNKFMQEKRHKHTDDKLQLQRKILFTFSLSCFACSHKFPAKFMHILKPLVYGNK